MFIAILVIGGFIFFSSYQKVSLPGSTPDDAQAEAVAFGFVQDFIALAAPANSSSASERIWSSLSEKAKRSINKKTLRSDVARFLGVQDIPDQGASVEDLQKVS